MFMSLKGPQTYRRGGGGGQWKSAQVEAATGGTDGSYLETLGCGVIAVTPQSRSCEIPPLVRHITHIKWGQVRLCRALDTAGAYSGFAQRHLRG